MSAGHGGTTSMTFDEFVDAVRRRVDVLTAAETLGVEAPTFAFDGHIARWQRRHQWAQFSTSPETGPHYGYLLVLGRDPNPGPLGAQSTPIPFNIEADRADTVAGAIADHFAWRA